MSKKPSFEEPTLFLWDDGEPIVSNPAPLVGQELGTFAASCVYAAAVKDTHFRCLLSKCPEYLLKCF